MRKGAALGINFNLSFSINPKSMDFFSTCHTLQSLGGTFKSAAASPVSRACERQPSL
jgi:hypothetical protein